MSKLRITPRNNFGDKNKENQKLSKKDKVENNDLEVLIAYLDKNASEFTIEDIKKFKIIYSKYTNKHN